MFDIRRRAFITLLGVAVAWRPTAPKDGWTRGDPLRMPIAAS